MSESNGLTDQYRKAQFNIPIYSSYTSISSDPVFAKNGITTSDCCLLVIRSTLNTEVAIRFANTGPPSLIIGPNCTVNLNFKNNHMVMQKGTYIQIGVVSNLIKPISGGISIIVIGV